MIHMLLGAEGQERTKRELLSDSQIATISQRAAATTGRHYTSTEQLEDILQLLLRVDSVGLRNFGKSDLEFIRDFCLGLNRGFVSEAFGRIPSPPLAKDRRAYLTTANEY